MFLTVGTSPCIHSFVGMHTHQFYEIIVNTKGVGTYSIIGKKFPFQQGSVAIFPAGIAHSKESADGFCDIYFLTREIPFLPPTKKKQSYFFEDSADKSLQTLAEMILSRFLNSKDGDHVLSLMYDLFLKLLSEKYFVVQYDSVVEKLRFQLTMGFNDPDLSLTSLMEKTGYNKDYIRRKFVTSFGMTPVEYLTSIRIENAKKLLATRHITKTPIGEIGAMCGYYDRLYFSRIFKKNVGVTPEQYAKKYE